MKTKTATSAVLIFCAASFIISAAILAVYVYSFFTPENTLLVSGVHDGGYKVIYSENEVFGGGAVSANRHYLMSYTDYFEFDNSFSCDFGRALEISYQYKATATLLIRHIKAYDGSANPVVYEVAHTLAEKSGSVTGGSLSLSGDVLTLDPKGYLDTYWQFVKEQQAKMLRGNMAGERKPQFAAELLVDFTCQLQSASGELGETVTCGYIIPLTSEVYSFTATGTPTLEKAVTLQVFTLPPLPVIIALVAWFTALALGIFACVRRLALGKHNARHELKRILARYADEIAVVKTPVDLSEYLIIPLGAFSQLLKLAVNMGKQIIFFKGGETADFYVFADGCAYCFSFVFKRL